MSGADQTQSRRKVVIFQFQLQPQEVLMTHTCSLV